MKVTHFAALDEAGLDHRPIAERATRVTAKMVFEDGFFHADPHPGNLVGTLDDRLREGLANVLVAVMRQSPDRLATALLALGTSSGPVDRMRLRDDLADLMRRYGGRAVGDLELGSATTELMEVVRRHRLRIPPDLALLVKVLTVEEGVAEQLDPDFQIGVVLAPASCWPSLRPGPWVDAWNSSASR